jgi:benzoate/toluate 1,2-dioxygenase subunit alpha
LGPEAVTREVTMLDGVHEVLETALDDDVDKGVFRCRRDIFTDPAPYELEIKHILEGNWIYLAHESQLPNKNDFLIGYIDRQPIVIARDGSGRR